MNETRIATAYDLPWLLSHERLDVDVLQAVIARGHVVLASTDSGEPVGWLRWGLLWDEVPFMNLLMVLEPYRGAGLGRLLVES